MLSNWVVFESILFPNTHMQGNVYNESIDLTCDSTGRECLPKIIADEYWIKVHEMESSVAPGETLPL